MTKIAFVQKCPSTINFEKQYKIADADIYNLSSEKVSRLLKKNVDLPINTEEGFTPADYDYVILIGSEALKMFTKATAVSDYTGKVAPPKPEYEGDTTFLASISPAVLAFKPENKPVFEFTVKNIEGLINGTVLDIQHEGDYKGLTTTQEIKDYFFQVLDDPTIEVVGLDSETSDLDPRRGYVLGISMSHEVDQGIYADADAFDEDCICLLQKIIDTKRIVLHNAKFDMHFLTYHFGIAFEGRDIHDTMIMHYVLDERPGHGLKPLTMKYGKLGDYDRELDEFKKDYCKAHKMKQEEFSYDLIPWDIMEKYAAKDTDATLALYYKFYPLILGNEKLSGLYHNLLLPALHFLTRMEARGIPVNKNRLEKAKEILDQELIELKEKLWSYDDVQNFEKQQGAIFNPNSPIQLRKLLFDVVGLEPTGRLTGTGAISTDAEALEELSMFHEIPKLILGIRKKSKLKNTYIDKLLPVIHKDSRVRTGFNLTTTTSGRLSSSGNFNMQQLPRDNPIIKGCVVAPKGYRIVARDLTTAEVYYAAVLSNDKNLQAVFINMNKDPKKYPDFHSNIAHMVFHLPCEPAEVKKKYPALRQAAKAITFGILYGSGAASVAEQVNLALLEANQEPTCTKEEAQGYITTYFQRFPTLKRWIDSCHAEIKTKGYIYNFFGRKRRLHNINSADRGTAAGEVRSGFNAIIQSVSSDHLLLGAIEADKEILEKGLDAQIFALVHDSVVAIVREDQVAEYEEILDRNIQTDRGCSIPGCPIGVEADSEEGGSENYACGKLEKMFPELAEVA